MKLSTAKKLYDFILKKLNESYYNNNDYTIIINNVCNITNNSRLKIITGLLLISIDKIQYIDVIYKSKTYNIDINEFKKEIISIRNTYNEDIIKLHNVILNYNITDNTTTLTVNE